MRIHRLLRPLRSSLHHLHAQLEQDHQRTLYALPTAQNAANHRLRISAGGGGFPKDEEWSSRGNKRKRRSIGGGGGTAAKRAARVSGGGGQEALGGHLLPSSSPFKQIRRARGGRNGTTYGSRRGSLPPTSSAPTETADLFSTSTSTSTSTSQRPSPLSTSTSFFPSASSTSSFSHPPHPPPSILSPSDLRSRLSSSPLSPEALTRALAVLKAYQNLLLACAAPPHFGEGESRGRMDVPSLAEVAAKEVGWAVEEEVEAALAVDGEAEASSSSSSSGRRSRRLSPEMQVMGHTQEDEEEEVSEEGEDEGKGRYGQRGKAEWESEHQKLVEQWYESVPEYARRWLLSSHATSLLLRTLSSPSAADEDLDEANPLVPYSFLELCFEICLSAGASSEAIRYHSPLLLSALRLKSPPSPCLAAAPSQASTLLPLLRRSPSPLHLLHHILLPLLLSSSFSERLFYHPFLSLSANKGRIVLGEGNEHLLAGLITVLAEVGGKMVAAISDACANEEGENGKGLEGGGEKMVNEVLRRLFGQAKVAIDFLLPALLAKHYDNHGQQGSRRTRLAVEEVVEALSGVVNATKAARANQRDSDGGGDDDEEATEEEDEGPLDDLRALLLVAQLALLVSCSYPCSPPFLSSSLDVASPRHSCEPDSRSLRSALKKYLLPSLTNPSAIFHLCDAILASVPSSSSTLSSSSSTAEYVARALLLSALDARSAARARNGEGRWRWGWSWTKEDEEEARERLEGLRGEGMAVEGCKTKGNRFGKQEERGMGRGTSRSASTPREEQVFDLHSDHRIACTVSSSSSTSSTTSRRSRPAAPAAAAIQVPLTRHCPPCVGLITEDRDSEEEEEPIRVPDSSASPERKKRRARRVVLSPSRSASPAAPTLPPSRPIHSHGDEKDKVNGKAVEVLVLSPSPSPPPHRRRPSPLNHASPPHAALSIWPMSSSAYQHSLTDDDELDLLASFRSPPSHLVRDERRKKRDSLLLVGADGVELHDLRATKRKRRTSPSPSPEYAPSSSSSTRSSRSTSSAVSSTARAGAQARRDDSTRPTSRATLTPTPPCAPSSGSSARSRSATPASAGSRSSASLHRSRSRINIERRRARTLVVESEDEMIISASEDELAL
ncbi:hypothetical protein JCM11251_004185 [Rhodosporidiobolus azoricus]